MNDQLTTPPIAEPSCVECPKPVKRGNYFCSSACGRTFLISGVGKDYLQEMRAHEPGKTNLQLANAAYYDNDTPVWCGICYGGSWMQPYDHVDSTTVYGTVTVVALNHEVTHADWMAEPNF